ncbi:hypothetical protein [Caulobacter sp. RL271]|uniref:Uncharacterized protein n=1 Tax=Caulobacter segnis TaxID=88688 RepID=A0ABY5A177_9CAUL|nr:hypothetical protein [Caulobacter segnis]USQ98629.1 hypothetical protein MZV50_21680 [Caulobacter segnis]
MTPLNSLPQWSSLAALLITAGLALWRGGWPERLAGVAMILAWFATYFLYNYHQKFGPQTAMFLVDLALMLVLLFIALRSNRWWPMWACGFHGLSLTLVLATLADPKIPNRASLIAGGGVFSYLAMAALFFGALPRRPAAPARDPSALTPRHR